jgi:hypothetical protein
VVEKRLGRAVVLSSTREIGKRVFKFGKCIEKEKEDLRNMLWRRTFYID